MILQCSFLQLAYNYGCNQGRSAIMSKKKRREPISQEERDQREGSKLLGDEVQDLHEISLIIMSDEGILPPLYAGEHLEDDREVIPLWGMNEEAPELGAMLLRIVEDVEPNTDL